MSEVELRSGRRMIQEATVHWAPEVSGAQQTSGVGLTFAAIFIAEIGDIGRLPRPEKPTCWAGLTPAIVSPTPHSPRTDPLTGRHPDALGRGRGLPRTRHGTKLAANRTRIIAARGRNIGVTVS